MLNTAKAVTPLPTSGAAPAAAVTEDSLLELVARGDRAAYAGLYDLVAPAVYGTARRVVVDPSMAEEVTQEVLLAVWSRAASFDRSRGSARSWVLTMAHRRAVDVVRSEQASRNRADRVAAASVERPFDEASETVIEGILDRARTREVKRAMETLSDVQRSALELAYYRGFTYREVAEILGVPLGTAKTRIRDGLLRLAAQLSVSGAGELRS